MLKLIAGLTLGFVLGWLAFAVADPADDLKACQAQTATLTMDSRQAQQERDAYVARLGKMLARSDEQLEQAQRRIQEMAQELQRLKAKPEEKK